jgi:Spy/CpxP family protein refolding chaperone
MNHSPDQRRTPALVLALGVVMFIPALAVAQGTPDNVQPPQDARAPQTSVPQDPIAQLNLSPEQRQRIRAIREQSKEERAAINRRLREATIALDQAVDADVPNEALIEQRAREAGEAQAAFIRLKALTELRVRRVFTPEQIAMLRQLRAQSRREQRQENRAQGRPAVNGRQLPNQRNSVAPDPTLRPNGLPRRRQE